MKISKSLLQAIVVGVSLGTAASSCGLVEPIEKDDLKTERTDVAPVVDEPTGRENENNGGGGTCGNGEPCPACGMG